MTDPAGRCARLFRISAVGALGLHAFLLLGSAGIQGGADLLPHLRLMQSMSESPGLRSVYAPAYHVIGALLTPWLGFAAYTRLFAFASAAALILGFRSFQRAARLPDAAAALFAWSPYLFALSWCLPKVEAAGYALAFYGLAALLEGRHARLGAVLAATFAVHTAAALFLGLGAGVLALARRDVRALAALLAGCAVAAPLLAAHLAAGCSLAQSLLFSSGDYLRRAGQAGGFETGSLVLVLAGPITLAAAAAGLRPLWRRERAIALLCGVVVLLCLNELWLKPFGIATTLNLLRSLTLLAFASAIAAGAALAARPRATAVVLGAAAVFAVAAALVVVPESCFVRSFDVAAVSHTRVDRCTFRWRIDPE